LPSRNAGTRELLSFGWNLMGAQVLGYLSKSTPAILIGYKHGATSLGFFERAMQILMLPLNQLSSPSATIAVPILSRLQNTDQQKYNKFFLFGQNIIVHAVVLSLSLVATQTERLVLIVLGEPWLGVVPIFQALSIGGTFLVFSYSSYWIFLSKGITNKLFRFSLISKPLMIVLTSLGLFWGPVGVALMYSFSLFVSWLLSIYWLRHTGVPIKEMVVTPLFIGFVYFISAYISNRLISTQEIGLYTGIIWGWITLLLLLLTFYFLLSPFRKSVNQVFEIKTYIKQAK
jgi:PST family polysaccharide transporter